MWSYTVSVFLLKTHWHNNKESKTCSTCRRWPLLLFWIPEAITVPEFTALWASMTGWFYDFSYFVSSFPCQSFVKVTICSQLLLLHFSGPQCSAAGVLNHSGIWCEWTPLSQRNSPRCVSLVLLHTTTTIRSNTALLFVWVSVLLNTFTQTWLFLSLLHKS